MKREKCGRKSRAGERRGELVAGDDQAPADQPAMGQDGSVNQNWRVDEAGPDRLYRGLGLDDADLDVLLSNLAAGRGVPSREAYSPEKLADFAVTESLAHGAEWIRALFTDKTPEVEAALQRLESALVDLKCLFRAEVASRLAAEPELELRLFDRVVKSYVLGEIPHYMQSAARGGADGAGSGCALFFAVEKGLKQGKHSVVIEFDRPASGVIDMELPSGVYPAGIHEFVILGGIPGPAVRAVWIEGRRFTPQEFVALSVHQRRQQALAALRSGRADA